MSDFTINPELINAVSNLSLGVVAILSLSISLWGQAKNNAKLAKSVKALALAIEKKEIYDKQNAELVKKSMEENTKATIEAAAMIKAHAEISEKAIMDFNKVTNPNPLPI